MIRTNDVMKYKQKDLEIIYKKWLHVMLVFNVSVSKQTMQMEGELKKLCVM